MNHLQKVPRKIHPFQGVNILSTCLFCYTLPIFRRGLKKEFQEPDLYEVVTNYQTSSLGRDLEQKWNVLQKKANYVSCSRLLWSCYGRFYLILAFVNIAMNTVVLILEPYCVGTVVSYFAPSQIKVSKTVAYLCTSILLGLNLVNSIYTHNNNFYLVKLGIKIRSGLSLLIYKKILKLDIQESDHIYIGKTVAHITKDLHTLETFVEFGFDVFISIIKTIVVSCVLAFKVGLPALAAIGIFLLIIPSQVYGGFKIMHFKKQMCQRAGLRYKIIGEVLKAIKTIKMYTWENYFEKKISPTRRREINSIFKIFLTRVFVFASSYWGMNVALYLLLKTYFSYQSKVTAEIVYFVLSSFRLLRNSLSFRLPKGLQDSAELYACIKRIECLLNMSELNRKKIDNVTHFSLVEINNLTFSMQDTNIFDNVNLVVRKGLTLIKGPVSCGKSSLLKIILREYQPQSGEINIQGKLSYASQEPWLFVSTIRQNILFGKEYNRQRYEKVIIVCALEHDLEFFPNGDLTIVEDRGNNLSRGQQIRINLARAVYDDADIYLLDDCLSALDAHVAGFIFKECFCNFLCNKVRILITNDARFYRAADQILDLKSWTVHLNENIEIGDETQNCLIKQHLLVSQTEIVHERDIIDETTTLIMNENINKDKILVEEIESGAVKKEVYKKYLQFGGGYFLFIITVCIFIATQLTSSFTLKFVSIWVNIEQQIANYTLTNGTDGNGTEEMTSKRNSAIFWYGCLLGITSILSLIHGIVHSLFMRQASLKLHQRAWSRVLASPLHFFNKHSIGIILNRFSKDFTTIDEVSPIALYLFVKNSVKIVIVLILIIQMKIEFVIPSGVFFVLLFTMQKYYLKTATNLKRLDASTRSPVIGYINSTLEGLPTIRALGKEQLLITEFSLHQDVYTSASFTVQSTMMAFNFALDVLGILFIGFIIFDFLIRSAGKNLAGNVGFVISQALVFAGTLQWGVRQYTEIAKQMTSVERILEYADFEPENNEGKVPEDFYLPGLICLQNVSLTYPNCDSPSLKNINLKIQPFEKVGIVGRTGAGKTSIISAMLRFYEIEGQIEINSIDIQTLPLKYLRSQIAVVPQDSFLFSGTLRDNLDPNRKCSDEELWTILESTSLTKVVKSLSLQIMEDGVDFSAGQKQLMNLARAMATMNKIVVFDEVDAYLDSENDDLISDLIHRNFNDCTVIIIAHKLKSVLRCDKVVVVEEGEIIECGEPSELLNEKGSMFYSLLQNS